MEKPIINILKMFPKGGAKNEQFRKEIVPYMNKIVYYPESTDIFDIAESDGISYYLIATKKPTQVAIINKSDDIKIFNNRVSYNPGNLLSISLLNVANTICQS